MYFIPLSQPESVELVIHALRVAAGTADCSVCPVRKVCMKQCQTIADAIERMWRAGVIPSDDPQPTPPEPEKPASRPGLRIVK